jgi:hypothetical protein
MRQAIWALALSLFLAGPVLAQDEDPKEKKEPADPPPADKVDATKLKSD